MLKVMEAIHAPINFDIIDHFSFENVQHRDLIKKNQCVIVGNLGEEGARYIENTKFYKWLDLFVDGIANLIQSFMSINCQTSLAGINSQSTSSSSEKIWKVSIQESNMKSTLEFLKV